MTQTAINYAAAVFELGIPKPDLLEAEAVLQGSPELFAAICNPSYPAESKHRVIDKIFQDSVKSFLKLLCDNGSASLFFEIMEHYKKLEDEAKKKLHAELVYFDAPSEVQLSSIKEKLKKMYDRSEVELTLTEDRSIIGGFIIRSEGKELDYSVKGRLEKLGQKLIRR